MSDPSKHDVYEVNTIASYDRDIIPLLGGKAGVAYERDESGKFVSVGE